MVEESDKKNEFFDPVKMVNWSRNNRLCFNELEHLNKTGDFLWVHPILQQEKFKDDFINLKERPDELLALISTISQRIRDYNSRIKNKKYKTESQKENWIKIVSKSKIQLNAIKNIL